MALAVLPEGKGKGKGKAKVCVCVCVCVFETVTGLVQLMQYYYQCGSLYRLRALGERRTMDITVGMSLLNLHRS